MHTSGQQNQKVTKCPAEPAGGPGNTRACHLSPSRSHARFSPTERCTWAPLQPCSARPTAGSACGGATPARTPLRQRQARAVKRSKLFNSTEPVMEINTDAYRPLIHTHTPQHRRQEAKARASLRRKRTRVGNERLAEGEAGSSPAGARTPARAPPEGGRSSF